MQPKADIFPFPSPAERHREQVDALFIAPSASQQYHVMQLEESEDVDDIADRIAEVVHDVDRVGLIEDRKQRARVRFAAVHALRGCDERWERAARVEAITHCAKWMREDGGATFRECSDEHLTALATYLAPRIVRAYLGVMEGTSPITPLQYLRIRGAR